LKTGHVGHKQPTALTFSVAFPLAQKTLLLKFDFLNVGHVGHIHNFAFSSLSRTVLPKNFTKTKFGFGLIMLCDCIYPTTGRDKDKRQVYGYFRWCYIILSAFIWVPVSSYSEYLPCPKCKSQMNVISNYCNFCGTNLHQPIVLKICPKCISRMDASAHFCPECGQKQ